MAGEVRIERRYRPDPDRQVRAVLLVLGEATSTGRRPAEAPDEGPGLTE
jgi:hypothetical protein